MSSSGQFQQSEKEMEVRLRKALEEAKSGYKATKKELQVATEHLKDSGLEQPDGKASLHKAMLAHNYALDKYRRALKDFNRFILDWTNVPSSGKQGA
jgi:hypothetical protein